MSNRMFILAGWLLAGSAAAQDGAVARGKYLAEQAIVCQECHTPKLENGEYDRSKWMKGAALPYAPLKPIPNWHKSAPDLTPSGLLWKNWGPEAIARFLETGLTPKKRYAGPPMPAYRLTREDAVAIVEYLKTLP
jgi:mono/diheme cytochrome c family protein